MAGSGFWQYLLIRPPAYLDILESLLCVNGYSLEADIYFLYSTIYFEMSCSLQMLLQRKIGVLKVGRFYHWVKLAQGVSQGLRVLYQ